MLRILVVGAGNFGSTLAAKVTEKKCDVTVIENNPTVAQTMRDLVSQVIVADGTKKEVLSEFAKDVDVAVVALGEKIDASILVTHFLKELGVKRIISKAVSIDHMRVLKILGANEVVFPERDEALRVATSLVAPNIIDMVDLSDEINIAEVAIPNEFANKDIQELDVRSRFGIQILAVKNPLNGKINILPGPHYKFQPDDIMVVIGELDSVMEIKDRKKNV